jgi:hypothetical protein
MEPNNSRRIRRRPVAAVLTLGATVALTLASGAGAVPWHGGSEAGGRSADQNSRGHHRTRGHNSADSRPVRALVITPGPGDVVGGAFNVDVSLQAKNSLGNTLLSGYQDQFIDPTGPDGKANPAFHPGSSEAAPGLVVTLSTTPSIAGTPLVGPSTNLAGVFQENSVSQVRGRLQTWNDWEVTKAGFFGEHTQAVLTVYAVAGNAPNSVPAGGLRPISNVVKETFRIR